MLLFGETILSDSNVTRYGPDSFFVKSFVQNQLGLDVSIVEESLESMEYIPRDEQTMKYRGHQLTRSKAFFHQSAVGIPVYKYTGYQISASRFSKKISSNKTVKQIVEKCALLSVAKMEGDFNHVIVTLYKDGTDGIGFHKDKTQTFTPGSFIVNISIGAPREFHLIEDSTGEITPIVMESGDLFIIGWKTNQKFKHSLVSQSKELLLNKGREVGYRYSVCLRDIQRHYTLDEIKGMVKKADASQSLRKKKKEEVYYFSFCLISMLLTVVIQGNEDSGEEDIGEEGSGSEGSDDDESENSEVTPKKGLPKQPKNFGAFKLGSSDDSDEEV